VLQEAYDKHGLLTERVRLLGIFRVAWRVF